VAKIVQ